MLIAAFLGAFVHEGCSVEDATEQDRRIALGLLGHAWEEEEGGQGFSWHPGCVMFLLPDDAGGRVEVCVDEPLEADPLAERAILVPFEVTPPGIVRFSDYNDDDDFPLDPGHYALLFQTWWLPGAGPEQDSDFEEGSDAWIKRYIRLTFVKQEAVEPRILVADEIMRLPRRLIMGQ